MLKVVTLFSGGGGVEAGLVDAFGEFEGYGVELNPKNVKLSSKIADCYERNFPKHKLFRRTIEDMAATEFSGLPKNPDFLLSSNECVFSSLEQGAKLDESEEISQAMATMQAVYFLQPKHFCLENVKQYLKSNSFRFVICENLKALGYNYDFRIVRLTTHQSRDRLILWASKGELLPEPQDAIPGGWWWAVADLVDDLPETELAPSQLKYQNVDVPTWLNRCGRTARPIPGNKPVGTITKSIFIDSKGGNRNKFACIILPDGRVKQASIECIRRLQTFPDWYCFIDGTAVAGSILGNAVPPQFIRDWLGSEEAKAALGVKEMTVKEMANARRLEESIYIIEPEAISSSFVYLIKRLGDGIYKIGITTDIGKRLNSITYNCGSEVVLEIAIKLPKAYMARFVEAFLHKKFENKKIVGEWFRLNSHEVSSIKQPNDYLPALLKKAKNKYISSRVIPKASSLSEQNPELANYEVYESYTSGQDQVILSRGSGSIIFDQTRNRYLYKFDVKVEGEWKSRTKYIKKELLEVVQSARSQKKSVREILSLI